MNPTVKRSGWHPPEDTGLWAIADRVTLEVCIILATCTCYAVVLPAAGEHPFPCGRDHSALSFISCAQNVQVQLAGLHSTVATALNRRPGQDKLHTLPKL